MEKAVIYARYSSHNQTENSIEAQVQQAREYARRKNYTVVEVFADRAKTGTNDNREAFQEMLKKTESHSFTVIIVWKVDRFGRNREEIALNKYKCRKNGVRIEYVAEQITDGPEGVILESVLEGFAEYYSKALSQNTKRGLYNKALKGGYLGGPISYGYKVVDGEYKVDEEAAKKIKSVFKMFNSGERYADIARALNLNQRNVKNYLKNKQYTGIYTKCGLELENIIPPIINKEEFEEASKRMGNYTKRKAPLDYILTGKIVCKSCGKKYTGCSEEYKRWKYSYYRSTCKCGNHLTRISKNLIEASCCEEISNILKSDENLTSLVSKIYLKLRDKLESSNSKASKEALLKKRKRLIDAYEKGVLEMNELSERLTILDEALAKCSSPVFIPDESQIKKFILDMKNINSEKVLIENFISKITVDPETKEYKIWYKTTYGQAYFQLYQNGTDQL